MVVLAASAIAASLLLAVLASQRAWITVPGMIRAGDLRGGTSGVAADVASTTVRHLPVTGYRFMGRPSHDGRWLPYSDTVGNLWTWAVATQQARQVTANLPNQGVIRESLMSPDGKLIAYAWETAQDDLQLRVVDAADGSNPTTIWPLAGTVGTAAGLVPLHWSRDGRQILRLLEQEVGRSELVLITPDGSGRRVLAAFDTGAPRQASLSPDGSLVAFDLPASDQATDRDLMIVRADGSAPARPLLTGGANDLHPS